MTCPMCGSRRFFIKDPDDPYETYPVEIKAGQLSFDLETNANDVPEIQNDTEAYCEKCAWHGKLEKM